MLKTAVFQYQLLSPKPVATSPNQSLGSLGQRPICDCKLRPQRDYSNWGLKQRRVGRHWHWSMHACCRHILYVSASCQMWPPPLPAGSLVFRRLLPAAWNCLPTTRQRGTPGHDNARKKERCSSDKSMILHQAQLLGSFNSLSLCESSPRTRVFT